MTTPNYVITIGRQFGAGGRELGKTIAAKLGIAYYDKELLEEAAKASGASAELFESRDERFPSLLKGMGALSLGYNPAGAYAGAAALSDDSVFSAQCAVIQEIARRGPCVIVGRSADYVLRGHGRVASVFVHAPIEARCRRIMSRGDFSGADIERVKALAERTDKLRSNYYNFYTGKRWGDSRSYDLTLDSSLLAMDALADVVIAYVNARWP